MLMKNELMIKVDNVSKKYKLGQIGGTTLNAEFQRLRAKIRHQEDPTRKIGAKDYNRGETFMALDGISFEVKKGERIGIIGKNGAGKSTLLKLLSRVTGPTSGEIGLNGRVASMLEVGTGFHPELTGRENIYMNGAILGMTKKEIDSKIEKIIDFSEVRQFIDTPVKRYSSGMYVKLAFSVAAHLDSEILIMDEVLAVGDMAFQKKCIDKMNEVSRDEGRTILYVSHNMNTIAQLCNRCIVLDHGHIMFDGDVEKAIEVYLDNRTGGNTSIEYKETEQNNNRRERLVRLVKASFDGCDENVFLYGSHMRFCLEWLNIKSFENLGIRLEVISAETGPAATAVLQNAINGISGQSDSKVFDADISRLCPGKYNTVYSFFYLDSKRNPVDVESCEGLSFVVSESDTEMKWKAASLGSIALPNLTIVEE